VSGKRLPVHGFVLAGGKSSRMGVDKATMLFCGRPMVEIAVEKLRGVCAEVSIVGNREDLVGFAPVVPEARLNVGPAAGIEAGLRAATQPWAMFVPVDVPLVPEELLRSWVAAVIEEGGAGCGVSFLRVNKEKQPAFCAILREGLGSVAAALERGERRLADILASLDEDGKGRLWACDAESFAPKISPTYLNMERWFCNVNTPQELLEAEAWVRVE
jgi:molybdenum cofactor guanylyltransferase